jgi:predicted small lipoprotein YifL
MSPPPFGLLRWRRSFQEPCLVRERSSVALALLALCVAGALAGCGRSGGLELPPGPAVAPTASAAPAPAAAPASSIGEPAASGPTALETAQKTGFDANGNPVAPPGQKKSFVLDPLLQ